MKHRILTAAIAVLALGTVAAGHRAFAASPEEARPLDSGSVSGSSRTPAPAPDASRALPAITTRAVREFVTAPGTGQQEPRSETLAPSSGLPGREPLTQSGCVICLTGAGSVSWVGSAGSFHVDGVYNYRASGTSGTLDLQVALSSALPVFGNTITSYRLTDYDVLGTLAGGFHFPNVNSGTVNFFPSTIPAGTYWAFLLLREYIGGTSYNYTDFMVMNNRVSCNGAACSTVTTSCVEDAYTMCLVGGRYQVTSHWRNQYAGGATANLYKAKLTDATGAFWIADSSTYEYLIRFNTTTNNGRIWVAIPTFTDVEFWVAVTDTVGGQYKEYHSLAGNQTLIYDPFFFVYP